MHFTNKLNNRNSNIYKTSAINIHGFNNTDTDQKRARNRLDLALGFKKWNVENDEECPHQLLTLPKFKFTVKHNFKFLVLFLKNHEISDN